MWYVQLWQIIQAGARFMPTGPHGRLCAQADHELITNSNIGAALLGKTALALELGCCFVFRTAESK